MSRKISVEIVGDSSGFSKALKQAGAESGKFGSVMGKLGKAALVTAGAAGLGGLFAVAKTGFAEFNEGAKVAAQTNAVLKSTGAAAGVSAKQVSDLAASIMEKSGIDDEAIQSGENLLLTFTGIRNEAGKGNDVFNRATKIMADMSVAMGQDMKSSAIQLGKALNDPAKGMTALQRVGVTFTDSQKKTVAALVKTGDVAGAQKLILAELTKEFGGSAAAAGNTLPGQLDKAKQAFNNAAGAIVGNLLPGITVMLQGFTRALPVIAQFVSDLSAKLRPSIEAAAAIISAALPKAIEIAKAAFATLKGAIEGMAGVIQSIVGYFREHNTALTVALAAVAGLSAGIIAATAAMKAIAIATKAWAAAQVILNLAMATNPFVLAAAAIIALGAALVVVYTRSETFRNAVNNAFASVKSVVLPIVATLQAAWAKFGDEIIRVAQTAFGTLKTIVANTLRIVQGVIDVFVGVFTGDWNRAWNGIKGIVSGALGNVLAIARNFGPLLLAAAKTLGTAILTGIQTGVVNLVTWIRGKMNDFRQTVVNAASQVYGNALGVGKQVVAGIAAGIYGAGEAAVKAAIGWLASLIPGWAKKLLGIGSPSRVMADQVGMPISLGIAAGIEEGAAKIESALDQAITAALDKVKATVESRRTSFGTAFASLADAAGSAFDKLTGNVKTPAEKALAEIQRTEDEAARAKAVKDAQAAIDAATTDQEKLDAAERMRQAQLAITIATLTEQAETERTQMDERNRVFGEKLQERLTTLATKLGEEGTTHETAHKAITALLAGFVKDYENAGGDVGEGFIRGIRAKIKAVETAAGELAKAAKRGVAGAAIGGVTGGVGGAVEKRAGGGPVAAGKGYLVGENGPEFFMPKTSGMIVPNSGSMAMAGGGGVVMHNTFSGTYVGPGGFQELARQLAVLEQRATSRNG